MNVQQMIVVAAMILLLSMEQETPAQWGPRSCAPVGATAATLAANMKYEWRSRHDDPERLYLFRNDMQIGGYDRVDGYYRSYDAAGDTWTSCCQPPSDAPAPQQGFFGVDSSKLSGKQRYTLHTERGTQEISRETAQHIVSKKLDDDSQKLRITVIGPDDQRKKVVADLAAKVPELPDWAIVRDYPPNHWSLTPGFVTSGNPTIYCQAPSGKVLHRQDDYQSGADGLAEALRKAKNSYDSKKDPDLRRLFPWLANLDLSRAASYAIALALGVGGGLFILKRKAVTR